MAPRRKENLSSLSPNSRIFPEPYYPCEKFTVSKSTPFLVPSLSSRSLTYRLPYFPRGSFKNPHFHNSALSPYSYLLTLLTVNALQIASFDRTSSSLYYFFYNFSSVHGSVQRPYTAYRQYFPSFYTPSLSTFLLRLRRTFQVFSLIGLRCQLRW